MGERKSGDLEVKSDDDDSNIEAREIAIVAALGGTFALVSFILEKVWEKYFPPEPSVIEEFAVSHFQVVVGIPAAVLIALFVVKYLDQQSKKIEFTGFGFNFKGTSGEVIMWLLCFLSIIGSMKYLW